MPCFPPLPRAPARATPSDEPPSEAPAPLAAVQMRPGVVPGPPQQPPAAAPPPRIVTEDAIAPGSWLAAALRERGVPDAVGALIARELASLFDFRGARAGQRFRLVRGADGQLLEFDYIISPSESVHLRREGERYIAYHGEGAIAAGMPTRSREPGRRE